MSPASSAASNTAWHSGVSHVMIDHHCITIAFFSRSISLAPCFRRCYKWEQISHMSANPTSFRLSKKQPLFSRSHLKLLPGFSRGKKWMLSSFRPPSLHVPPLYQHIHYQIKQKHPKMRPTGKELLVKKNSYRIGCAEFFFSSALLQVQPSWFLVNA